MSKKNVRNDTFLTLTKSRGQTQGVKCRMVLVVNFFVYFFKKIFALLLLCVI